MTTPNLNNALKELLSLPHYKNYAACSGAVHNVAKHEDAIADLLIKHGFKEINRCKTNFWTDAPKSQKIPQKDFWNNHLKPNWVPDLPNNVFIQQPFGTHACPDFIIKWNNILFPLEAKSVDGKNDSPLYNGGLPKPTCVYAFCCSKYNKTTIYRGCDIMDEEKRKRFLEHHKKIKALCDEFTENEMKDDPLNRGFIYYDRAMYQQKKTLSGISKDYFKHPDREKCEIAVFDWIKTFD